MVVLPATHPLATRSSVSCAALDGAAAVGVRPDIEPSWAGAAYEALGNAGVTLRLVQEADTKIALLGLVAAGMGLSVVSESMAALGRDGVVFRPLRDVPVRLPLAILTARDVATTTPAAAAFLAAARALHRTPARRSTLSADTRRAPATTSVVREE